MSDNYANYAFISYSHKDEKWAAWIQQKLEAYRLPSIIRKEAGSTVPERIRPVFRDATDLGAGRLRTNLHQELESSRFLIVVCSPNSAKPNAEGKHWVNDEVTHFASLGRTDRIIPVIIEGDEKTAFCPKLAELGVLAVDATKKSRARTLNDIVAALLGLRPDELWQREERLHRRKCAWRAVSASAALLLAAVGTWRLYDLYVTHVEYYSDWVDEWGIPTGIPSQRLTKDQVRNRLFSYRFEFKGRQKDGSLFSPRILKRVVMQDADGNTLDMENSFFEEDGYHLERPRIQILRYTDDGGLESIDDRNCENIQLVRHKFSGKGNVDVEHVRNASGREIDAFLSAFGTGFGQAEDDMQKSAVLRFSHVRDEHGRIVRTIYKSTRENEAHNADGIVGVEYVRDGTGRPVRETFLFNNRTGLTSNNGVVGRLRSFSEEGDLLSSRSVDRDGNLRTDSRLGCAEIRYERDWFGNATTIERLDETGVAAVPKDGPSSVRQAVEEGRLILRTDFDSQICPTATISFTWNNDGTALIVRCYEGLDLAKQPLSESRRFFDGGNCVRMEWKNGDGRQDDPVGWRAEWKDGHEIKRVYFNSDGKPIPVRPGHFSYSIEYNEDGLQTAWFFLDENERPAKGPDGWAGVLNEYKDGKPVRVRMVDEWRRPVLSKSLGAAGLDCVFKNGNMTEMTYVGTNGLPVLCTEGFAKKTQKFENGNLRSWRFLGLDGKPVAGKDGKAGADFQYDEDGRLTEYLWIGTDANPVVDERSGAAGYRLKFDDSGNEIEFYWIGTDGTPCCGKDGCPAGWRSEYDSDGNLVKQVFFDEYGNEMNNNQ